MLRTRLKSAGCRILHPVGADRWARFLQQGARAPVVLCYHRVVEDFPSASASVIPSMLISRQTLEQHLDALGRSFEFISLDQLAEAAEHGKSFARPAVAITFDDGYSDVYFNAFPILNRKGIPAAVFVITELAGTARLPLHDHLYFQLLQWFSSNSGAPRWLAAALERSGISPSNASRLASRGANPYAAARALLTALPQKDLLLALQQLAAKSPRPEAHLPGERPEKDDPQMMNWEMLAEMQRSGLITVGSHTATHPVLGNETRPEIDRQLRASRRQLESQLHVPIRHLAYPDGRFDAETLEAAAEAGYCCGYTTCSHCAQGACASLAIPRRVLWEKSWLDHRGAFSPDIMSCHLSGLFDWAAPCKQNHRLTRRSGSLPEISTAETRA